MHMTLRRIKSIALFIATGLMVTACGGTGDIDSSQLLPVANTLSGKAAAGAPIIGTVTIKDSSSPARTKTVPIQADGNYTVSVDGLKAPFMVRADGYVGGNEYHLYSAGTAADVGNTINITPLTDLIVANIAGSIAKTYFDSGSFSTLTATQLTTQAEALKAQLLPVLQAVGLSSSIDLLRSSFSTDHTGLDAALDVIKITTNTTTNVATITNIITQQQMTSSLATGSYTGALTDTTGVAAGVSDIQAISAGFKRFSDLFATGLPGESTASLLALFDSATFMQGGQSLAGFLSEITTDKNMIGLSFTNIAIQSMDTAKGTAVVTFDVMRNGIPEQDAPDYWCMIKKSDKWYMQGDQRIAEIEVQPRAEYHPSDANNLISTGLGLYIADRGGRGITSAVVTGKGISTSATLVNQINYDEFTLQGNNGGSLYAMTDTQISTIADTGESYTIKLYSGTTLLATYTQKIRKRPYKKTELSSARFPAITTPTVTDLRAFIGGATTVTWTLPVGLTNDWLSLGLADNAGNSAKSEYSLAPATFTQAITLSATTSTGQAFIPANRWLWLSARDSYGRKLSTTLW